jgi:hypothetical protein
MPSPRATTPGRSAPTPRTAPTRGTATAAYNRRLRFTLLLSLALSAFVPVSPADANGGKVQVERQPAGPYAVTVFTDPTPIPVGVVDVSVAVQPVGSSFFVPNAQVTITTEPIGHPGAGATYPATHEQADNKRLYAANVDLPQAGRWRLTVQVTGPFGDGALGFEVEAGSTQPAQGVLAAALVVLAGILLALGGWRITRRRRTAT